MTDSNATERFTTLCAMLTEFEDAALAIRVEASDTQAREEVWRNAIGDLAQEYATEIEGMYTPEQAVAATLGAGECEPIIEPWACAPNKYDAYCGNCKYPLGDGKIKPWNFCPNCGKAVKR